MTVLALVEPHKLDRLGKRLAEAQRKESTDNRYFPFESSGTVHFARWSILEPAIDSGNGGSSETYLLLATVYDGKFSEHLETICANDSIGDGASAQETAIDVFFECCRGYPDVNDPVSRSNYIKKHSTRTNACFIGAVGRTVERILKEDEVRRHLHKITRNHERAVDLDEPERLHQEACEQLSEIYEDELDEIIGAAAPTSRWNYRLCEFLYEWVSRHWLISLTAVVLLIVAGSYRAGEWVGVLIALIVVWGTIRFIRRCERRDDEARKQWLKIEEQRNKERREVNKVEKNARSNQNETVDGSAVRKHHAATIRGSEDRGQQNPLTSMIEIKSGLFRRRFLALNLALINFLARHVFVHGSLAGLESIHFARWSMVENSRFLLFLSDYDGSWESYLGDFINEAPEGVTSIWTNTIFFPRTRFLFLGGVTDEQAFKSYGRYMMSETQYFFSAYPHLSVRNILQNRKICAGLADLQDPAKVREWAHLVARRGE